MSYKFKAVVKITLFALLAMFAFHAGAVSAFSPDSGPVIITEFMASNEITLADEDGNYPDWVELYNSGATEIDLDGYYLTDDSDDLSQWRLPAVMLAAENYLVVFASSKDRAIAGAELHANFMLKSGGEYLALVKPDGMTIC